MRYVLKQKFFTVVGSKFRIQNEAGEDFFFVDGTGFLTHKLSFQDMAGNELAFIQQKPTWGAATYEIYRRGALCAVMKQKFFTIARCRFMIDVPGPDDLEAVGSLSGMEYSFTRRGQTVALVSAKWFSWADTYGVDIADGEDDILILACAVVIDVVLADSKDT